MGSTGLRSTIKQSGQTFCYPSFSKFLSQSLRRGSMSHLGLSKRQKMGHSASRH